MIVVFMAVIMVMAFMPSINPTYAATKPSRVKITKVSVKGKTVTVKWKKAKGAKKYQVKAGKKVVKTTATTSAKFKVKKSCKIKVRGINGKKKGRYSKSRKAKIKKVKSYRGKTPAKVEGLKVSVNHYTHTATVTWKKAKYATKYQVLFRSGQNEHPDISKTTRATTYKQVLRTADDGYSYSVVVRGINGSKCGKWSKSSGGIYVNEMTHEINGSTLTEGKGGTVTLDYFGEVTFKNIDNLNLNGVPDDKYYSLDLGGELSNGMHLTYTKGYSDETTNVFGFTYCREKDWNGCQVESSDFYINPLEYNDHGGSTYISAKISNPNVEIAYSIAPDGEKPSEPSLDMDEEYADFEDMHGATVTAPTNGVITYGGDMEPYKDMELSKYNYWIKVYDGDTLICNDLLYFSPK